MKFLWIAVLIAMPVSFAHAHEKKHHKQKGEDVFVQPEEATVQLQTLLSAINGDYVKNIKPIFERKCFDCHSNKPRYPWYYSIPGARQLIDSDIREALKHLDMSEDFPFKSHASPGEDLEGIAKAVRNNSMPPWRYWILHLHARLTPPEKSKILNWADTGRKILEPPHP